MDLKSDLHGFELEIIPIDGAAAVARARAAIQVAIGELTDALATDVDQTPAKAFSKVAG